MRIRLATTLIGVLLLLPGAAAAKVIETTARLAIEVVGAGVVSAEATGLVSVAGNGMIVPAGLLRLTADVSVPTTGITLISDLILTRNVRNLQGTLSHRGVTKQLPGEVCPGTGHPDIGEACVEGRGLGGRLALSGVMRVVIVPMAVTVPVELDRLRIGQGGSTNIPLTYDAAAWTTGQGLVFSGSETAVVASGERIPITLVSPVFVNALGIRLPVVGTLRLTHTPAQVSCKGSGGGQALIGIGTVGLLLLIRRST